MFKTVVNAWKVLELRKKILYTFLILIIFRIGASIPVPFVDATGISEFMKNAQGFSYLDLVGAGALSQATLFALGISPYITSSIVIQLLGVAIPALENLSKEGPEGQKKLGVITRWTTLGLALLQSIAYYILNRNQGGIMYTEGGAGVFAAVVIVASFTAGSMALVWLGEQIDKKGIGNGTSMILFAGIVSRAPRIVIDLFKDYFFAEGGKYYVLVPLLIVAFVFMIWAVVIMTNSERRIPVQYAKRVVGRKMYGGQSSFMPIKVTMSGVMPVIFASSILSMPAMIKMFIDPNGERTIGKVLGIFEPTNLFYVAIYIVLIVAFNYFQIAIQYDPMEMANNLRKNSGAIPGIRPGQPTADFIKKIMNKITLVGALFIAAICIIPILTQIFGGLPVALGGTSLIIVVGVALDTVQELESQMMMRHYKGFLE